VQGRGAVVVGGADVGAFLEEKSRDFQVPALRCMVRGV
jgi:hypothetical protein